MESDDVKQYDLNPPRAKIKKNRFFPKSTISLMWFVSISKLNDSHRDVVVCVCVEKEVKIKNTVKWIQFLKFFPNFAFFSLWIYRCFSAFKVKAKIKVSSSFHLFLVRGCFMHQNNIVFSLHFAGHGSGSTEVIMLVFYWYIFSIFCILSYGMRLVKHKRHSYLSFRLTFIFESPF